MTLSSPRSSIQIQGLQEVRVSVQHREPEQRDRRRRPERRPCAHLSGKQLFMRPVFHLMTRCSSLTVALLSPLARWRSRSPTRASSSCTPGAAHSGRPPARTPSRPQWKGECKNTDCILKWHAAAMLVFGAASTFSSEAPTLCSPQKTLDATF